RSSAGSGSPRRSTGSSSRARRSCWWRSGSLRRPAEQQVSADSSAKIPHLGVVYKPYSCDFPPMLKAAVSIAALVALVVAAAAAAAPTRREAALLREMNRARGQHGLRRLRIDANLERAARSHSREMLAANVFAHGAFGSRMVRFAVTGSLAGENLAWGTGARGTARGIVAAW